MCLRKRVPHRHVMITRIIHPAGGGGGGGGLVYFCLFQLRVIAPIPTRYCYFAVFAVLDGDSGNFTVAFFFWEERAGVPVPLGVIMTNQRR